MAMVIGGYPLGANSVGGSVVLTDLEKRGTGYTFKRPQILRRNGQGAAVTSGYASIEWKVEMMPKAEYLWWRDTLLGGFASKTFNSASLYDDRQNLTAYSNCVVEMPEYEYISVGYYFNVTIRITNII